jgi:hypothetical protein
MVMDMDPHQQTSIILGKPFLKSVRANIDNMRGMIDMKIDGVHEKFIYHSNNLTCCCQIRAHRYPGSRKVSLSPTEHANGHVYTFCIAVSHCSVVGGISKGHANRPCRKDESREKMKFS